MLTGLQPFHVDGAPRGSTPTVADVARARGHMAMTARRSRSGVYTAGGGMGFTPDGAMLVVAGAREVTILPMGRGSSSTAGGLLPPPLPHKTLQESATIASFTMSRDGTEGQCEWKQPPRHCQCAACTSTLYVNGSIHCALSGRQPATCCGPFSADVRSLLMTSSHPKPCCRWYRESCTCGIYRRRRCSPPTTGSLKTGS